MLCASAASAQGPAQQGPVTLSLSLQRSYAAIKDSLTQAADKLPEADYAFKPSSMPEVRTYGQLFGHVANAQFGACSAARGVPNPNMGIDNEQKTTKAEIVKKTKDQRITGRLDAGSRSAARSCSPPACSDRCSISRKVRGVALYIHTMDARISFRHQP
jgi:hypothetical protein